MARKVKTDMVTPEHQVTPPPMPKDGGRYFNLSLNDDHLDGGQIGDLVCSINQAIESGDAIKKPTAPKDDSAMSMDDTKALFRAINEGLEKGHRLGVSPGPIDRVSTMGTKADPVTAICNLCSGMTKTQASATLRAAWARLKA